MLQKRDVYILFFLLFTLPWLLVCGGQYETGTDYGEYMSLFHSGDISLYLNKKEYLFAFIVEFWHNLNFAPQGLYYIFYLICFCFLGLICKRINNNYLFLFIILYFTVSNLFFNQLNFLRQSLSVYIITYGCLCYIYNRCIIKFLLAVYIASLFHASSWIALVLPIISKIEISSRQLRIISLICFSIVIIGGDIVSFFLDLVSGLIPLIYRSYLSSSFNSDVSFIKLLPKLFFFPLYFFSIQFLERSYSKTKTRLFIIGMFAYLFRLLSLTNVILDRLGYIFILVSILPLFLYWEYLSYSGRKNILIVNIFICVTVFLIKTILFPSKEYDYQSIYLRMLVI